MSFYGSEPIPNTSTSQPLAQPRLSTDAWSGAVLDQLVLQDKDNPLNHMGGLRRPNTQPQSNDPNFSIVDAATPDLASFPTDQIGADALLLDSARLDFDTPFGARSTPNHLDQRDKSSRSQPAPAFRQQWEHPPAGISSSNVDVLKQEVFEVADVLGIPASAPPESFAAREKHGRPLGVGGYVQRLMEFNTQQQRGRKDASIEHFWKPLINAFFAPDATLHIDLKSSTSSKSRSVKLPAEVLPRIWKSKLEAGMSAEHMLLEDPCEFLYPNGVVAVDCPRTVIITTYQNTIVHTDGHLRVSFHRNNKIAAWEFSCQKHEEMFTRKAISMGVMMQPPFLDFGVPNSVVRLMMIANDIYKLKEQISEEVSKIVSDPRRLPGFYSYMAADPGLQTGQNGNAFKAISSVLDRSQLDPNLAASLGMSLGRGGQRSGGRGLTGDLVMDIKAEVESESNVVPNLRDTFNSWNSEQQSPTMFQNLLDETVRSPLMPTDAQNIAKSSGQSLGDLNLNPRKGDGNLVEGRINQPRQSAIEAVAAAASGQGGWGLGAPGRPGLGTVTSGGEELDRSLQLIRAGTGGGFPPRRDSGTGQRGSVAGQNAPPGLAKFTPQTNDSGRPNEGRSRRGRGGSRGGGRASSGGQEFQNLQTLQRRMSGSKQRRDSVGESGHNAGGGGSHGDFVGTSQGMTDQNGAVESGKKSSRGENAKTGKERGHGTAAQRRNAARNGGDERLEKRQKTCAQSGDQK